MAKGVITDVISENVEKQIAATIKGLESIAIGIDKINAKTGNGGNGNTEKAAAIAEDANLTRLIAKRRQLTEEEKRAADVARAKARQDKINRDAENSLLSLQDQSIAKQKQLAAAYEETARAKGRDSQAAKDLLAQHDKLRKANEQIKNDLKNFHGNVGNYTSAFDKMKSAWVGIAAAWTGAVAASAGVIGFMKSAVIEAMNEEAAVKKLTSAMDGNAAAVERMLRWKNKMMNTTMFSEDEIMGAVNMGLELGRTELQTKKMIETAMGLSRVTGVDLNTAMLQLSGTYEGNLGRLSKYAGAIKDLTQDQLANGAAVDILHEKLAKLRTEGVDTMEGRVKMMKQWWTETMEDIGFGVMNVFNGIKTGWTAITSLMGVVFLRKHLQHRKQQTHGNSNFRHIKR